MMATFKRLIFALLCLVPTLAFSQADAKKEAAPAPDEVHATATTGMEGRIDDLKLPGPQLVPKPLADSNSPIVLRVEEVFPHVDDWRYSFSFYGIVPGRHDLRDYLQRKDGGSMEGVPEIPVEIIPVRPINEKLKRPVLEAEETPRVGGYKKLLIAAGVLWLGILALMIFGFRKKTPEQLTKREKPLTLADQLRPLVKQAQAGELSQSGQADLERKLLGIWRQRLKLDDANPADSIIKLRKDEEAGALLRELEKWLHRPGSADNVDVTELLKPYEKLPAEPV